MNAPQLVVCLWSIPKPWNSDCFAIILLLSSFIAGFFFLVNVFSFYGVYIVSWGFQNTYQKLSDLKQIYFFTVKEVRIRNQGVGKPMLCLKFLKENLFHVFLLASGIIGNHWLIFFLIDGSLQSLPLWLHGVLLVCFHIIFPLCMSVSVSLLFA